METVYAVQWIEVEFGQRNEGFKLFTDLDDCIKVTRKDAAEGSYSGGYLGPERPLTYVEVPFECLEDRVKEELAPEQMELFPELEPKSTFSTNSWKPRFASGRQKINHG